MKIPGEKILLHIFYFFLLLALGWTEKLYAQDTSLAPGRQSPPDSVLYQQYFHHRGMEKKHRRISFLESLTLLVDTITIGILFLEIIQADQNKIYNLRLFLPQ